MAQRITLAEIKMKYAKELAGHEAEWERKYPEAAQYRDEQREQSRKDAAPLIADLKAAGFDVESVWDLFDKQRIRRSHSSTYFAPAKTLSVENSRWYCPCAWHSRSIQRVVALG